MKNNLIKAGVDEVGRGCLAGPVVAAAVILPENYYHKELNDSKKLTEKQRHLLRSVIEENAISYAAYRLIKHRFAQSPGFEKIQQKCEVLTYVYQVR